MKIDTIQPAAPHMAGHAGDANPAADETRKNAAEAVFADLPPAQAMALRAFIEAMLFPDEGVEQDDEW